MQDKKIKWFSLLAEQLQNVEQKAAAVREQSYQVERSYATDRVQSTGPQEMAQKVQEREPLWIHRGQRYQRNITLVNSH